MYHLWDICAGGPPDKLAPPKELVNPFTCQMVLAPLPYLHYLPIAVDQLEVLYCLVEELLHLAAVGIGGADVVVAIESYPAHLVLD